VHYVGNMIKVYSIMHGQKNIKFSRRILFQWSCA